MTHPGRPTAPPSARRTDTLPSDVRPQARPLGLEHLATVLLCLSLLMAGCQYALNPHPTVAPGNNGLVDGQQAASRPADIRAEQLGSTAAILTAGRPFTVCAVVHNTGELAAENVVLALSVPDALRPPPPEAGTPEPLTPIPDESEQPETSHPEWEQTNPAAPLPRLAAGQTVTVTWQFEGPAGVYKLSLLLGNRVLRETSLTVRTK